MARRGGPARLLTGNPLGGMLRDLDRRTRSTTRRSGTSPPPSAETGLAEPVEGRSWLLPPPPVVRAGPAAVLVVTGEDGRARWHFAEPYDRPPVLAAVAVDPAPEDDDRTATVALEEVTSTYAVVRVWRTRPRRGSGVSSPAGAGIHVHLAAYPLSG